MKILKIKENPDPGCPAWLIVRDDQAVEIIRRAFLPSESVPDHNALIDALCARNAEAETRMRELITHIFREYVDDESLGAVERARDWLGEKGEQPSCP